MSTRKWWRAWGPAVAWASVIFVLSSIPGTNFPEVKAPQADKLVHVLLYIALGAFCLRGIRGTSALTGWRAVAVAALIAGFYGAFDEIHQIFTPNRSPDWHDAAADLVGGIVGATVASVVTRNRRSASD